MLKIICPECKKSFLWTDDMPMEDKCPNPDCEWNYNIHKEFKRNMAERRDCPDKEKINSSSPR